MLNFFAERLNGNGERLNRSQISWHLKKKRNHVTYLLNKAKHQYYTEFVDENSSDQGRLFRA